jgi:hypothetical protein
MVKCPYCPKKFVTHHGLGGHLSGPCGIKLKASKAKASKPQSNPNAWISAPSGGTSKNYKLKPKPKPKPKRKTPRLKPTAVTIDFGKEMNAEIRALDRAKAQAAIPGKVAADMMKLAAAHRQKAEEIEKMANRMRVLA